jgi:hypothetical protein
MPWYQVKYVNGHKSNSTDMGSCPDTNLKCYGFQTYLLRVSSIRNISEIYLLEMILFSEIMIPPCNVSFFFFKSNVYILPIIIP